MKKLCCVEWVASRSVSPSETRRGRPASTGSYRVRVETTHGLFVCSGFQTSAQAGRYADVARVFLRERGLISATRKLKLNFPDVPVDIASDVGISLRRFVG